MPYMRGRSIEKPDEVADYLSDVLEIDREDIYKSSVMKASGLH